MPSLLQRTEQGLLPPCQSARRDPPASGGIVTLLILQISDRRIELAAPGGSLTKGEIAILLKYLDVQEAVAPQQAQQSTQQAEGS